MDDILKMSGMDEDILIDDRFEIDFDDRVIWAGIGLCLLFALPIAIAIMTAYLVEHFKKT